MVVDKQMEHQMVHLIQLEGKKLKDKLIFVRVCVCVRGSFFFFYDSIFFARVTFLLFFPVYGLSLSYAFYKYIFCSLWKEKNDVF